MNIRLRFVLVSVIAMFAVCVRPAAADEQGEKKTNEAEIKIQSSDDAAITGTVVSSNDDAVTIEVRVVGESKVGVPMLSKIPYVSRLFKNMGYSSETHAAVIRIPKSQIKAGINQAANCPDAAEVEESNFEVLPPPRASADDIQFFLAAPEWKACATKSTTCRIASAIAAVADGQCATKCSAACPTSCATKCCAACPTACAAECVATCPVATNVACDDCKCGSNCGCGKSSAAHVAQLHEQLVRALTENAQLKARVEMQHELADHKERFLHEMVAARIEVVKLQARLELAGEREQLVLRQRPPQPIANPHQHDHAIPYSAYSVAPVSERLREENESLKARIAEMEQRLNARTAAPHATQSDSNHFIQPRR